VGVVDKGVVVIEVADLKVIMMEVVVRVEVVVEN